MSEEQTWESLVERVRAGRAWVDRRACHCAACAEDPDYDDACEELITMILASPEERALEAQRLCDLAMTAGLVECQRLRAQVADLRSHGHRAREMTEQAERDANYHKLMCHIARSESIGIRTALRELGRTRAAYLEAEKAYGASWTSYRPKGATCSEEWKSLYAAEDLFRKAERTISMLAAEFAEEGAF